MTEQKPESSSYSRLIHPGHVWVRVWQERPREISLECRCSTLWRHLQLFPPHGLVLPSCPMDEAVDSTPPGPGWDMKRCVGRLTTPPIGHRCNRRGWTREQEYHCFQHPERSQG